MYRLDLSETEDLSLLATDYVCYVDTPQHYFDKDFKYLDISNCTSLEQTSIFEIKNAVFSRRLEYVDISGNQERVTILAVTCLCSCENIQTIIAHGYNFHGEKLLFLSRTFESLSSGALQLKTEDRYIPIDVMSTFEEELLDELFFKIALTYMCSVINC